MFAMTESPHRAVISRLSADFATISQQLARASADLTELDRLLSEQPQPAAQPQATPYVPPAVPYWPQYPTAVRAAPICSPATSARSAEARQDRSEGWIGKMLAVAGVAVTLIGVVLLLVLAAQAGILRPEFRVAGGAVLAMALVATAWWLSGRPGGRVGAIALAATGVAAAYIDVIAVTTIYHWVPAPVGLVIAAVVGGGGLTLARRWDSQHLGLLVLVPLIVLAPVVTDGITLLLVGFMLALSAASLPVQLGKDWIWLHASRTAASTVPLLVALAGVYFDDRPRSVAGGRLRHRRCAGHRWGADPVAAHGKSGRHGPADRGRCGARAVRLAGRRPGRGRIDGGRTGRGAAGDRADRPAGSDGRSAPDLVCAVGDLGADRGDRRVRRVHRGSGSAGDGRRGRDRGPPRRGRAVGGDRVRCRRWRHLPQLRPAEHIGGSHRDGHRRPRVSTLVASLLLVASAITIAWSWKFASGQRRSRCLGGCGSGDRVRRHRVHRHRRCAGGRRRRWLLRRSHGGDDLLDRDGGRAVRSTRRA